MKTVEDGVLLVYLETKNRYSSTLDILESSTWIE